MENFTIVITTFAKRYNYVVNLIPQIRNYTDNKIILVVNGEKDGNFDEEYRKNILTLCSNYYNVFPTMFIETRGLCKMWNTGLIMSDTDNVLILNDDIEIHSGDIIRDVTSHIKSSEYKGITRINNSFSHFIANKIVLDSLGYFDERLLGFGEEDGDISYRFIKSGIVINTIYINGVMNIISNIRHEHIKPGIGKYSSFNRQFIYGQKYSPNMNSHYKGMFDTPMDQIMEDVNQYPYEKFFRENKNNL
jgi:glycosyltransferase involved in cell wall biosynthesis